MLRRDARRVGARLRKDNDLRVQVDAQRLDDRREVPAVLFKGQMRRAVAQALVQRGRRVMQRAIEISNRGVVEGGGKTLALGENANAERKDDADFEHLRV